MSLTTFLSIKIIAYLFLLETKTPNEQPGRNFRLTNSGHDACIGVDSWLAVAHELLT